MSRVIPMPRFLQREPPDDQKLIDVTPAKVKIAPDLEDLAQDLERARRDESLAVEARERAEEAFNTELAERGLCRK